MFELQYHHQGAVHTLNQHAVLWHREEEEGARGKRGARGFFSIIISQAWPPKKSPDWRLRRRTTHVALRRMPRSERRGAARRSAQTVVRCGILGGSFPSRDSQQQNSLLCTILLSFMVPPPFSIYQLLTLCASALYQSMSLVAVHNTRFMKLAGEIQT